MERGSKMIVVVLLISSYILFDLNLPLSRTVLVQVAWFPNNMKTENFSGGEDGKWSDEEGGGIKDQFGSKCVCACLTISRSVPEPKLFATSIRHRDSRQGSLIAISSTRWIPRSIFIFWSFRHARADKLSTHITKMLEILWSHLKASYHYSVSRVKSVSDVVPLHIGFQRCDRLPTQPIELLEPCSVAGSAVRMTSYITLQVSLKKTMGINKTGGRVIASNWKLASFELIQKLQSCLRNMSSKVLFGIFIISLITTSNGCVVMKAKAGPNDQPTTTTVSPTTASLPLKSTTTERNILKMDPALEKLPQDSESDALVDKLKKYLAQLNQHVKLSGRPRYGRSVPLVLPIHQHGN